MNNSLKNIFWWWFNCANNLDMKIFVTQSFITRKVTNLEHANFLFVQDWMFLCHVNVYSNANQKMSAVSFSLVAHQRDQFWHGNAEVEWFTHKCERNQQIHNYSQATVVHKWVETKEVSSLDPLPQCAGWYLNLSCSR